MVRPQLPATPKSMGGSLANQLLLSVGIRVAAVILVVTGLTYMHVVSSVTDQSLEQLAIYIAERGEREQSIFADAENNHTFLREEMVRRLAKNDGQDPAVRFNSLFEPLADGTIRTRLERFDGTTQPFAFIGRGVEITEDLQRRILLFQDLSAQYGPPWHHDFQSLYFTTPENTLVGYWPEVPTWAHDAAPDLDIPAEEFFWVADAEHNPARETVWTGLFYDATSLVWMVSAETPVYIQDRHIATIGHDVTLNELMERTVNNYLAGGHNVIFRRDGRLIAHPNYTDEIQAAAGSLDINEFGDPNLLRILRLAIDGPNEPRVVEDAEGDSYLAITEISGPDWLLVQVFPKDVVRAVALGTARIVLYLGIVSLALELLIFYVILRSKVARPLTQFVGMAEAMAAGSKKVTLDHSSNDELGRLAQSFNGMSAAVATRTAQLEASEGRLSRMMAIAPDAIITSDENFMVTSFNSGASRVFGFEESEIVGLDIGLLIPEAVRERHRGHMEEFSNSAENSRLMTERSEVTGLRRDGSQFPAEASISKFKIFDQLVFVVMLHDVSHRAESIRATQEARKRAEYADRTKTEFIANMSHELRTPLNAIMGFAQMLSQEKHGKMGDSRYGEYATVIVDSGNHLLSLINDILDLSKIDAEKMQVRDEMVDVDAAVESCIRLVSQRAIDAGLDLRSEIQQGLPGLRADRRMTRQILLNLLSNALKFTRSGGEVTVGARTLNDGRLEMWVSDTGIGIAPEDIPTALETFGQIDGALNRLHDGTGLGLPLVKSMAELHGAELKIESAVGEGTTCCVIFPADRVRPIEITVGG